MEPTADDNIRLDLMAFADGELEPADTLRVLDYLVEHPQSLEWVRDQQRLTATASRVLKAGAAKTPVLLRTRIAALAARPPQIVLSHAAEPELAPSPPRRGDVGIRWLRYAGAAVILLFVGIMVGRESWRHGPPPPPRVSASAIPASMVSHASRVHADCSRLASRLHSAGFPRNLGTLADDVEQDLRSTRPYPDLSPIGFRYVGAGPCGDPLANTVHLLYRSLVADSASAVSLFVQRYTDQFPLQAGRVYSVSTAESPFPMLAWRSDRVVYFLVADDEKTVQQALSLIRADESGAPKRPGATTTATDPASRS